MDSMSIGSYEFDYKPEHSELVVISDNDLFRAVFGMGTKPSADDIDRIHSQVIDAHKSWQENYEAVDELLLWQDALYAKSVSMVPAFQARSSDNLLGFRMLVDDDEAGQRVGFKVGYQADKRAGIVVLRSQLREKVTEVVEERVELLRRTPSAQVIENDG